MNRSYRSLFNATLGTWVAAPETAKGHAKTGKSKAVLAATAALLALGSNGAWALDGNALPQGGTVTAGSGTLSRSGNTLTVNQTTGKLAIDWQSFNIGQNATVNFVQPGSSSIALNRVIGSDASQIYGRLNANGQVFLLNANGVLFGKGSEVNVGGLVASTLSLSNADFLAGNNYRFTGTAGRVINQGNITAADHGYVALLGGQVSNQGTLVAKLGNISLPAGRDITLDFAGDSLINLQVNQGTVNALAENKQLIRADGGAVLMTARAADRLIQAVVNNEGVIEARGIDTSAGTIKLLADMDNGTVKVGGTLDASARTGSNGGFVETSGQKMEVRQGAQVAVGSGGRWLIDPTDLTIDAAMASTIATALSENDSTVVEQATNDITVASAISWSSTGTLTLNAGNNIAINANISAGTGTLRLYYGNSGGYRLGNGAQVNLSAGNHFYTKQGSNAELGWTVITALGSTTGTDLQEINGDPSGRYVLGANIDASATSTWNSNGSGGYEGFAPIGSTSTPFEGIFDGLGHTISGLTINRPGTNYVGLFGMTDKSTLRNIGLVGGSVKGGYFVGGLVGENGGSISNAYVTASVTGNGNTVGGLVGYNNIGSISNAYATGSVTGSGNTVGGLVGLNRGSISNTYATGSVTGSSDVGGLVGSHIYGSISNAYATGRVMGGGTGGLVGYNGDIGSISNAYWNTTTGQSQGIGTNNGSTTNVSGKSTAELASALPPGFSSSVWGNADNQTTPYLLANASFGTVSGSVILGSDSSTTPTAYGVILNVNQLQNINSTGLSGKYVLGNNIDASATSTWNSNGSGGYYGFTPIGDPGYTFRGIFDGLGHTISGLTINRPSTNFVGLFGFIDNAILRNVGLVGGSVTGYESVGGLVGTIYNSSSISNAYATGSVTGYDYVGGLVGHNLPMGINVGSISNTYATGSVTGKYNVGGLVGANDGGTISNAYATGSVTGSSSVGGLVGWNDYGNNISNAYFDTTVNPALFACGIGCSNTGGKSTTALKSAATFASWDISDAGGSASVWRIYEGSTTPLLRSFLTPLTISAAGGSKTYDGSTDASAALTYSTAYDSSLLHGTLSASTASKNVGTYSVSPAGLYSGQQGYDISYVAGNVTIAPRAVTLTAPSVTKTYDGTTTYTTSAADLTALSNQLVGGDTVTAASIAYTNKNAGSGNKTVTLSGLTLDDGNNGGNYTVTAAGNSTSSIDKLAVTLTAPSVTKTYDGGTTYTIRAADLAALSSQLIGGDTVTAASLAYADKNAGSGNKTVTLGGLTLDDGNNGGNYTVTAASNSTSSIQKATLTLTASSGSKIYDGTTSSSATVGVSGLQSGDSLSGLTESYASKNVLGTGASTLNVDGSYRLADGNNGGNYIVVTQSATGTITKASATVTANSGNTTYNGLIQSISGFTAAGLVNGETTSVLSGVTTSGAGRNAGTYTTTVSGTDDNYNLTFVDGALTIQKAQLTVTADNKTRLYGQRNPTFTETITGFVNGENATSALITGSATGSSTATISSAPGSYTITGSTGNLAAANYDFTAANGTLTISESVSTKPTYQAAVIDAHGAGRGLPTAWESFADNGRSDSEGQFITVVDGGLRLPRGLE